MCFPVYIVSYLHISVLYLAFFTLSEKFFSDQCKQSFLIPLKKIPLCGYIIIYLTSLLLIILGNFIC